MDIRDLDLNLLFVIDSLFEEGTLTRAAQHLKVSQPTMSASLAKLRLALGDELFVRSNGVMQPTARALLLRPIVTSILSTIRLQILAQNEFDHAADHGTFTLSMSDIGELEFLPRLLARFAADAPLAKVRTVVIPPHDLVEAMSAGEVDLAMGYFPDLVSSAIKQQSLFRRPWSVIVRKEHPTIRAPLSLSGYLAAQHIAVAQQGRSRDLAEVALVQAGIKRQVTLEVTHFLSVPSLVAQSDLVGTLPQPLAAHFARAFELVMIDPPFPIPETEVKQFWHRRFDGQPRLQWLRRVVAETSQNRPSLGVG